MRVNRSGATDASAAWLPDVVARIAAFLPPNDIAGLCLVDKATADQLQPLATVRLSQPASPWLYRFRWAHFGSCRSLNLKQRRLLLSCTAASGDLQNIAVALEAAGCTLTEAVLESAAAADQLPACRWLLEPGRLPARTPPLWRRLLEVAAGAGSQAVCDWCLASGTDVSIDAICAALRGGHTNLADRLMGLNLGDDQQHSQTPWREELLEGAAAGCDLALLQRLSARFGGVQALSTWGKCMVMHAVVSSRTTDWQAKAEWLLSQGVGVNPTSGPKLGRALGPLAPPRLSWLRVQGCPPSRQCIGAAVINGSAPTLSWLLSEGVAGSPSSSACEDAAAAGSLEVLRVLHAAGRFPQAGPYFGQCAARSGSLELVAWAHETGRLGALGPGLMRQAALSGSAAMVRWLRGRGCGWDERAWSQAALPGSEEALEALAEGGCPQPVDGLPFSAAAYQGDLHTLEALRRLGLPLGGTDMFLSALRRANGSGAPLAALQWLLEAGAEMDWERAREPAGGRTDAAAAEVRVWVEEQWRAWQARAAAAGVDGGGGTQAGG